MSKVIEFPNAPTELIPYWSQKYGQNEAIILIKYVTKMARQFNGKNYPPYDFEPTIEFHLRDMHKYFPELKTNEIKKALLSLNKKEVITWVGDIKNCEFLIFTNHEDLLKDLNYFEGNFHE